MRGLRKMVSDLKDTLSFAAAWDIKDHVHMYVCAVHAMCSVEYAFSFLQHTVHRYTRYTQCIPSSGGIHTFSVQARTHTNYTPTILNIPFDLNYVCDCVMQMLVKIIILTYRYGSPNWNMNTKIIHEIPSARKESRKKWVLKKRTQTNSITTQRKTI